MQHAKEKYQQALRSIEREGRMYVCNWNCAMSCGVSKYIYAICPHPTFHMTPLHSALKAKLLNRLNMALNTAR